jgi:predicted nucleic acid-binding Zn ribbon protein
MKIEEVLGELLGETSLGERVAEAEVVAEWNERVGDAIAAVTVPMRVSRGTLIVGVRSSAWLMELQMMERQILRKLNQGRTRGRISRIRFVMAGA